MKLQSLHSLFPDVKPLADRLCFSVKSRTRSGEWRVDKETRMGMGSCECPNFQKGGNVDCFHIKRVDKYMACESAQRQMLETLGRQ